MAETVCDIIPIVKPATNTSPLPELVYFINKLCVRSHINCHVAIIALIYLHRCKRVLPKGAVGNPDTAHRIFLASVLTASKFLHDTTAAAAPRLTNQKLCDLCDGMYTLRDIGDLERAFLKVIKYRCWVSHDDIQRFLSKHRADMLLWVLFQSLPTLTLYIVIFFTFDFVNIVHNKANLFLLNINSRPDVILYMIQW